MSQGEVRPSPRAGELADSGDRYSVRLVVDGKEVPLKRFLHDMLGGSSMGLISGLHGIGEPREVEIHVRRT